MFPQLTARQQSRVAEEVLAFSSKALQAAAVGESAERSLECEVRPRRGLVAVLKPNSHRASVCS